MINKSEILVLFIWLSFCLIGCKSTPGSSNNDEITENIQETSVDISDKYADIFKQASDTNDYTKIYKNGLSASFRIVNKPDNGMYEYSGEAIEIKINSQTSFDTTVGYLIYINGIPQKYYTDYDTTLQYMHYYDTKDFTEVTIYVRPDIGNNGETLNLTVADVIGAAYRPLGAHDPMQPGFDVKTLAGYKIKINCDAYTETNKETDLINNIEVLSPVNYTAYELGQMIITHSDGTVENKLENLNFVNTQTKSIIENSKLHMFTEFGGNVNGEYSIYVYLNGKLIKSYKTVLSGYLSRAVINEDIAINEDMANKYEISDYNTLVYIAVPSGNNSKRNDIVVRDVIIVSGENVLK